MRYGAKSIVRLLALFVFVTFGCASSPSGGIGLKGEDVIRAAMKYMGRPYRHGMAGPNLFDCSGFTSYIFSQFGISLSRDSRAQYTQGVSVGRKDLRIGDLVFFTSPGSGRGIGHVGIVSKVESDGNFYFVHAARRGVVEDSFRASAYYYNRYVGARRVISDKDTLTIAMCGDIMMGTTYPTVQLPDNDGRDIFADTRQLTLSADLAVGNLEGAITDGGHCTKGNGPNTYAFRMPTSYGHLLGEAGYDYLSQANNHANDFDTEGVVTTEQVLDGMETDVTRRVTSDFRQQVYRELSAIGGALTAAVIDAAKEAGCERIMLEVRADNIPARGLYKKYGFEEISIRRGYYGSGVDAVIMEKML